MPLLVLDDRRFADDALDASVAPFVALRPDLEPIAFSAFAARLGLRVVDERTRAALLRRLTTGHDLGFPPAVARSTCFAEQAASALDRDDPALPPAFVRAYRHALGDGVLDAPRFWERVETAAIAVDDALLASPAVKERMRARGVEIVELPQPSPLAARVPNLLAAVQRLVAYLDLGADVDLRAFALSIASPLRNVDARALTVAAARDGSFARTLSSNRVRLGSAARDAISRFCTALESCTTAYRAPGTTASTLLAEIALAFALEREPWLTTLGALCVAARAFDAALELTGESAWRGKELVAELEAAVVPVAPLATATALTSLPQHDPLLPAVVDARRSAYSASSLNTYAECTRKWYFRYVCAAIEDPGSSASTYGRAFHHALEEFHRAYPRPGEVAPAILDDVLAGLVTTAFDRYRDGFTAKVEFELQRRRALRTAKRYLRYILERFERTPFTVIGCELEVAVELAGYRFVGFIDRVDREDRSGGIAIVDYKTGSIAESAAEYRDAVLNFTDFQLPFYYWAQTAAGERVTRLALVPLRDAHLDVRPIELEVVPVPLREDGRRDGTAGLISVRELERARAKMIEICEAIERQGPRHFPATDDPQACRYCIYIDACREAPLDIEARFAR